MNKKNIFHSGSGKIKCICTTALILFIFSISEASAQSAISATGGDASGSGGSVSYSVGQIVYTYYAGTNGSVAQGVQQPYEISVVSGIENYQETSLILMAYPNPTKDFITLKIVGDKLPVLATLYSMEGKLLESIQICTNETKIDMSNLLPSVYFLKVFENGNEVKTFKIIKN